MILKKSLPITRYGVEKLKNCFSLFSKTVKDRVMKFSGMIDISFWVCTGLCVSTVTSGRHRKWKKKLKFLNSIFQIKSYTTIIGQLTSDKKNWPHQIWKNQLPGFFFSKRSFKFSIFNALNLLHFLNVWLEINICCRH
jgi:hypothetical protein